jgi:cation:H+ antiporter
MNILLLIGGLILILLGANGLTDGAASVAKRFRIPFHRNCKCKAFARSY